MLQVDENIGGRQDQKSNGLRTKTLAVGLLMVLGCFAVGYFSATTTTTATTTTAHTRVDMSTPSADASTLSSASSANGIGDCPVFCKKNRKGKLVPYNCCGGIYTIDASCASVTLKDCGWDYSPGCCRMDEY